MTYPKHYDKEYEVLEMVKIKFLEVNAVIVLIVNCDGEICYL